ncbi:MAG: CBS domain-containing protein [Melioribacteraceae bacterium]|nr:CBS domain-containing protein [Melioribacteraceae bacterium]MCF8355292.1 CBS domain-containing protein [Melioribacteraceae bacterium]MCF8394138.1 CBS domain-containing protein [Melioribacteraceae bacterium]MCF8418123.1 CBS domain-containing protein [Melioribacteraceae bacterium]
MGGHLKTAKNLLDEKKSGQLIYVDPGSTIYDAVLKMDEKKIGAMLVKENDKIVGIYTERDLLKNSADPNFDIRSSKISEKMSTELIKVEADVTIYKMMDIFLGRRIRHLIVEKNGEFLGVLSQGDVVRANLNERTNEINELKELVSFEYYSNWHWDKKK